MCGSLNWYLVWGCSSTMGLLRLKPNVPGGHTALCICNSEVKIPQDSGPNRTRFHSFQACLPATHSALERKRARRALLSLRARFPSQVIYLSIYSLLANTSLRNQERLWGDGQGEVLGGSWWKAEPKQRVWKSKRLQKLNVKLEHRTRLFERRLVLFPSEWRRLLRGERKSKQFLDGWVWVWHRCPVSSCSPSRTLPCAFLAAHVVGSFTDGLWEAKPPQPGF